MKSGALIEWCTTLQRRRPAQSHGSSRGSPEWLLQLYQAHHIATVSIHCVHPDIPECVLQLRILRDQSVAKITGVSLGSIKVGGAGDGVFDCKIKVLVRLKDGHISDSICLATGIKSDRLAISRNVFGLNTV